MAKIRNKRLHISVAEYIAALLLLSILIAGAFFLSQYLDVKKNYNIKDTSVDFIISAPSIAILLIELQRLYDIASGFFKRNAFRYKLPDLTIGNAYFLPLVRLFL